MRRVAGLGCALLAWTTTAATPTSASENACGTWVGRYSGELPESQNFFVQPEHVSVIVESDSITVQIWPDDASGFLGSADSFKCSSKSLRSKLDTGAEGEGKISLFMSRDKKVHMRLYGYEEGLGPNKAGYLPPEKLEISLRKVP
jgi:hypothetical protein